MTRQVRRQSTAGSGRTEGVASDVAHRLADEGFGLPSKPRHDVPEIPEDIDDLTDKMLMNLFMELSAWAGYYGYRLAMAEVDEQQYENMLRVEEAKAIIRNWAGTSEARVTVAKAHRDADAYVDAQRQHLLEKKAYRKLIGTLHDNVTRDMNLVSRELTRRTSYTPSERSTVRRDRR